MATTNRHTRKAITKKKPCTEYNSLWIRITPQLDIQCIKFCKVTNSSKNKCMCVWVWMNWGTVAATDIGCSPFWFSFGCRIFRLLCTTFCLSLFSSLSFDFFGCFLHHRSSFNAILFVFGAVVLTSFYGMLSPLSYGEKKGMSLNGKTWSSDFAAKNIHNGRVIACTLPNR